MNELVIPAELTAVIPAITVLIQAIKMSISPRWLKGKTALLALVLGVTFTLLPGSMPDAALLERVITGLMVGASATGLHASTVALGTNKKR